MSGMSGKAIRETAAALGVIASMVFVGMEIRQNTSATRSATQNAIFDAGRQGTLAVIANAPLIEVIVAVENDPSLLERLDGTVEGRIFQGFWIARLNEMENAYLHHREGTLGEEPWAGWEGYIVEQAARSPFRHYWNLFNNRYGPGFQAMIADLLADQDA